MSTTTTTASPNCSLWILRNATQILAPDNNNNVTPFQESSLIRNVHEAIPRFGHSNNITDIILGSRSQEDDYMQGLYASVITISVVVTIWAGILIALQIAGPHKVGFWSGTSRNHHSSKHNHNHNPIPRTQSQQRFITVTRYIVLLCNIGSIIAIFIFLVQGIPPLRSSQQTTQEYIHKIQDQIETAKQLTRQIVHTLQTSRNLTQQFIASNDFCPHAQSYLCDFFRQLQLAEPVVNENTGDYESCSFVTDNQYENLTNSWICEIIENRTVFSCDDANWNFDFDFICNRLNNMDCDFLNFPTPGELWDGIQNYYSSFSNTTVGNATSDFVQQTLHPFVKAYTDWNRSIVEFLQGEMENPLVTLEERMEYYHDSVNNLRWVFGISASTYVYVGLRF